MKKTGWLLLLIILVLFTGCIDNTKKLIVYSDKIGLTKDFFGTYKMYNVNNEDVGYMSIYYKDTKYYINYQSHYKETKGYALNSFVPSLVSSKHNFYIFSFPFVVHTEINVKNRTAQVENIINMIVYVKKENNNLFMWYSLLSDKERKISNDTIIKKIILDKFLLRTLTKKPDIILKKVNSKNLLESFSQEDILNKYINFKK